MLEINVLSKFINREIDPIDLARLLLLFNVDTGKESGSTAEVENRK